MTIVGKQVSAQTQTPSKASKTPPTFLTLPQVQDYLGIKSRKTVLKYIRKGDLQAFKLGGTRWRLALADVDAFINSGRKPKVQR